MAFEAPDSLLGLPVDEETQIGEGGPGSERVSPQKWRRGRLCTVLLFVLLISRLTNRQSCKIVRQPGLSGEGVERGTGISFVTHQVILLALDDPDRE